MPSLSFRFWALMPISMTILVLEAIEEGMEAVFDGTVPEWLNGLTWKVSELDESFGSSNLPGSV